MQLMISSSLVFLSLLSFDLFPSDMKSLLFYSGELVKYAIVAELYYLTRT